MYDLTLFLAPLFPRTVLFHRCGRHREVFHQEGQSAGLGRILYRTGTNCNIVHIHRHNNSIDRTIHNLPIVLALILRLLVPVAFCRLVLK